MSAITDELLLRIAVVGGAVAAAEVQGFADAIAASETAVGRAEPKVRRFGSVLTSLKALFIGLGIVDAVKQFSSFQQQMEMLHTQTGATQQEVTRATKAILNMAVSVGTGPNSLAQALYHIESTQKRGTQAYNEMRVAAEGARIGNANLVDVTNALNAVVVGKLLPGTNAFDKAMGQLNATVGSGDMYMQDLASAYSTGILSSMKQVGLQLVDINAAMAVLGDNNIRGTQAANRLRMGLLQIVKPTNAAADQLHALHMRTFKLAEDYYKPRGLYVMLEDLHQHLDKLSKTRQNDVLMTLFGRGRMSAGVLTLYDQMDRLSSKYGAISKGQRDFNAAWQGTQQTLAFTIDQLKTLGEIILIRVGGAINSTVKWIRGDWIPALQHGKVWALAIASAIAVISAALIGPRALQFALTLVKFAMMALERVPLIALFTLIGLGVLELATHFKQIERVADHVRDALRSAWHTVLSDLRWLGGEVNKILGFNLFNTGGGARTPKVGINGMAYTGNRMEPNLHEVMLPGGHPVDLGPNVLLPPGGLPVADTKYGPMMVAATAAQQHFMEAELHINVMLDGKTLSKQVVRQGLMAQARRGAGGPTISDAG